MNFWNSSVASITASLQTMVAKLEGHAADQREAAGKHQEAANERLRRMDAALTEAAQADRVLEKLASILD